MHYAGHLAARVGSNGYHEAAVAKGDDLFLDGTRLASQNRLERTMNAVPAFRQVFPHNPEFGARVVVDFAVWKDFPMDRGQQVSQVLVIDKRMT